MKIEAVRSESYPFEMQITVLNADGHSIPLAVVIVHSYNFQSAKELVTAALRVETAERLVPTIHIDPKPTY
jgi:hypothetical protein